MKEVVDYILGNIKDADEGEDYALLGKKFTPVKISKDNFHAIKEMASDKKVAFYDGGNMPLIEAPNMCVHFIRLAAIFYKNNKKIKTLRKEFYCIVSSKQEKYIITTIPRNIEMQIDFYDKDLRTGDNKVDIRTIPGLIRRIAELNLVKESADLADFHVMDGTLDSASDLEEQFLQELVVVIKRNKKELLGLSKTNTITTKNGNSLNNLLLNLNSGTWSYYPLVKENFITITRLHKNSNHVFRLAALSSNICEALSMLKVNATDPVFLGYPYGLIQVDKAARVSRKQADYLKTQLMAKFGRDWNKIKPYISALNAHEILDNIG